MYRVARVLAQKPKHSAVDIFTHAHNASATGSVQHLYLNSAHGGKNVGTETVNESQAAQQKSGPGKLVHLWKLATTRKVLAQMPARTCSTHTKASPCTNPPPFLPVMAAAEQDLRGAAAA